MKPEQLIYRNWIIVLLLLVANMQVVSAIGSTYGIVQGFASNTNEVAFELYYQGELYGVSDSIQTQDDAFALAITFPESHQQFTLVPLLDDVVQETSFILKSGETIQINLNENDNIKQVSYKDIRDEDATKRNEDLSQGNIEPYEADIEIVPVPQIVEEEVPSGFNVIQEEIIPVFEQPKPAFIDKWTSIVLNPIVITIVLIAYMLVIGIFIRKKLRKLP